MATTDKQIGKNLAQFRGIMSQKELADRMRDLGWKWSQATVWSIEKGERPLRLVEAEALQSILGRFSVFHLLASETERALQIAEDELFRAHLDLEKAMREHFSKRFRLALIADSQSEKLSDDERDDILQRLEETPADIAEKLKALMRAEDEGGRLQDAALGLTFDDEDERNREMLARRGPFILKLSEDWDPYGKPEKTS